jgi:hypothetical protein
MVEHKRVQKHSNIALLACLMGSIKAMCMFWLIHFLLRSSLALLRSISAVVTCQLYRTASNKHSNSTTPACTLACITLFSTVSCLQAMKLQEKIANFFGSKHYFESHDCGMAFKPFVHAAWCNVCARIGNSYISSLHADRDEIIHPDEKNIVWHASTDALFPDLASFESLSGQLAQPGQWSIESMQLDE